MEKIKKFYYQHYGPTVELNYRMFCICSLLGTLTSLLGALLCLVITGLNSAVSLITIFAFIMMFILTAIGHHTKKTEVVTIIMSSLLNFIAFPSIFLTTGGLYSVAPLFFVMGIFVAIPILNKKNRNILFFLQLLFYCFIISLCFFFPNISYLRLQHIHIVMLLFSFIIVSFYTVFSTILVLNQYDKEQIKIRLLNQRLEKQAVLDPLTKLYNRRFLSELLNSKIQEKTSSFLIVIVDIDDFKQVNDTYGHSIGDQILVSFAKSLKEVFPQDCNACRYGGEEFLIYCSTPDILLAKHRMERVREYFIQRCLEQYSIKVTFSAGCVVYGGETHATDLIDKADALLYQAKREGKDKFLSE